MKGISGGGAVSTLVTKLDFLKTNVYLGVPWCRIKVKDLALSPQQLWLLLWHRFHPWPGNFHMPWAWPKRKKKKVYLILAVTLWDSYYSHFTSEETNIPKDCCLEAAGQGGVFKASASKAPSSVTPHLLCDIKPSLTLALNWVSLQEFPACLPRSPPPHKR